MAALTNLYRSDLLTLTRYDCDHAQGSGNVEESSDQDELVFVLKGVYQKRSSDGNTVLDPSRIAVFRKGQPYSISHPVDGGDQSVILGFNAADLCAAFAAEPDAGGTVLHDVPQAFSVTPASMLLAARLCHGARQAVQDKLDIDETACALLDSLSATASRMRKSRSGARTERPCARDVAVIVSSRYRMKLSIGDIARMLGVSPFHLCRSFRAATGTTIHRHITTLRMSDAVHRLWDYRHNLTELALDLGYSSHSHFSSTFRRFLGIAPSQAMAERPGNLRELETHLTERVWHSTHRTATTR